MTVAQLIALLQKQPQADTVTVEFETMSWPVLSVSPGTSTNVAPEVQIHVDYDHPH